MDLDADEIEGYFFGSDIPADSARFRAEIEAERAQHR
jgi:hypothetical protein